jgi:hypothetical protein
MIAVHRRRRTRRIGCAYLAVLTALAHRGDEQGDRGTVLDAAIEFAYGDRAPKCRAPPGPAKLGIGMVTPFPDHL